MMDDIVERLRVPCFEFGLDEGWIDAERKEAANKIKALEARVAKADALVAGLDLIVDAYGCDCAAEVQQLAAAYRESDT